MDGLSFRPLLVSDAAAILEIELAAEAAEPSESYTDLTEVEANLRQPGINLPDGSVAAMCEDRLVGFGALFVPAPLAQLNVYLSGAVLPDFRRAGIGGAILRRLTAQAQALRNTDHRGLPGLLKIWVQEGRDSADRLAASAGFTVRRYFLDMRADLRVPPSGIAAARDGIETRGWSPADDEGVRLAYNCSFADHWGSTPADVERWRALFAESPFFRPEFSRIAVRDGEIVGFVMVDEFPAETEARGYRTGYIDRVGTVGPVRGQGVAKALLAESLAALAASGCRYADLGVDAESPTGAGRLYQRPGFTVQYRNRVVGLNF